MPTRVLKKYFGYDDFRNGQSQLVNAILRKQDVLGIMPTGAGKSICFQVPALMMDGITLVVSPLISLMQDQVKSLIQAGVRAAYINSSLTPRQIDLALYNARMGKYKIIYVAPERLLTPSFLYFVQNAKISMLTVDEAHCISQWGQDFRPSYAQIPDFIEKLPIRPVVSAFTATATEQVKHDIAKLLELQNPLVLVSGFDRKNLYFEVRTSKNKMHDLISFLKDKKDKSGVIYCSTRKSVEAVYEKLDSLNFSVQKYHAGLSNEERKENQKEFIFDNIKIMVATNAFGMGIDKSNVNFVVHYNMPKDMESYYQEAGRAGRDGTPAHCLMLYSGQDVVTNQFLIENSRDVVYENEETEKLLKARDYKRLKDITFYSTTNDCLRKYILRYFGETPPPSCGNCSNCDTHFELIDATQEAKRIISCVVSINESFGKTMIVDILKGSQNQRLLNFGFNKLPTYGISESSPARLRTIIDTLISEEFLEQTDSQYATIQTTTKAQEILRNKTKFKIRVAEEKEILFGANAQKKAKITLFPEERADLYDELRALRAKLAKEQEVPAFVIFGDSSLVDMCQKLPINEEQFLTISGVGQAKAEKYGTEFIFTISNYCKENGLENYFILNLIENSAQRTGAKKEKSLILPSDEILKQIKTVDENIPVRTICENINEKLEQYQCAKVSAITVGKWLVSIGYLHLEQTDNTSRKVVTKNGLKAGITEEERTGKNKNGQSYCYKINLYPKNIQELIIRNVIEILRFNG